MSSGAPASDDSTNGGAPLFAVGTPPRAPSPDSWDAAVVTPPQSPVVAPLRVHTYSPLYDLADDNSQHTLCLELDFHQPCITCGNASIPLSDVFDLDHVGLTPDFVTHLQDTLLDALDQSTILTPKDRAFITTEIRKHLYSLHYVLNGRRMYITPKHLGRYLHTAYFNSHHDVPTAPVVICLRATFGAFRPEPFQRPSAMPPALPPRAGCSICNRW